MDAVWACGKRSGWVINSGILFILCIAASACEPMPPDAPPNATHATGAGAIQIYVKDQDGQNLDEDALVVVRVLDPAQADDNIDGRLRLDSCPSGQSIHAWSPGYYTTSVVCNGGVRYDVELESFHAMDDPNYAWTGAKSGPNASRHCRNCHDSEQGRTEFLEWERDGHSKVFVDPYFPNMYLGTDVAGTPGERTEWTILGNGERIRLPPDKSGSDYYGPGYRLDYPESSGNCAFCHVPAAVGAGNHEVDLAAWAAQAGGTSNAESEGITCDVCHKVTDVILGADRLPMPDRPGVLSMVFVRPASHEQFFSGPRIHGQDPGAKHTCSPVFSESKLCAACHYGKFSDVEVYGSYKEWLESPYSWKYIDAGSGRLDTENPGYRSCQDCHMRSDQSIDGTLPSERAACSKANMKYSNFNHTMMQYGPDQADASGLSEISLLVGDAAELYVAALVDGDLVRVTVAVKNTRAGHKLPTDSPLRHLILVVDVTDHNDNPLAQLAGPVIPSWGGTGNGPDDYGGRPGQIYANVLKDRDTGLYPTAAYWNPSEPLGPRSDTRLMPGETVPSAYAFSAPSHGRAKILVRLLYRYAFIDLARAKKWNRPDILVTSRKWECIMAAAPAVPECKPD